MTRQEKSGTRDLTFSGWVRENLPDSSTGFMVSDLDFILWNYKLRRLMLIEVKTYAAKMRFWQSSLFETLGKLIEYGAQHIDEPIDYRGFHCIRFEKSSFDDGRCLLDSKVVSEAELIAFLSMGDA